MGLDLGLLAQAAAITATILAPAAVLLYFVERGRARLLAFEFDTGEALLDRGWGSLWTGLLSVSTGPVYLTDRRILFTPVDIPFMHAVRAPLSLQLSDAKVKMRSQLPLEIGSRRPMRFETPGGNVYLYVVDRLPAFGEYKTKKWFDMIMSRTGMAPH